MDVFWSKIRIYCDLFLGEILSLPGGHLSASSSARSSPALAHVSPQLQGGRRQQHPGQGAGSVPDRSVHGGEGEDLCEGSQVVERSFLQTASVHKIREDSQ